MKIKSSTFLMSGSVHITLYWIKYLFFVTCLSVLSIPTFAVTRYVDGANVSGTYNGTSWATAYDKLETALAAATSGDEIWVAKGTYQPTATINLKAGVNVYGGFLNTHSTRDERNWQSNPTILKGNGAVSVLSLINVGAVVFDGFTVTGGGGTGGGGMYISGSSPVISNVIFKENIVKSSFSGSTYIGATGGAIYNYQSSPVIYNAFFIDNECQSLSTIGGRAYGGAIYNELSSLNINKAVFNSNSCGEVSNSNSAVLGGAIHSRNNSGLSPNVITNVVFLENAAKVGTAIYDYDAYSIVTNCTFSKNTVGYESYRAQASKVVLTNNIFYFLQGSAMVIFQQISTSVNNCYGYLDTYSSDIPVQNNNISPNGGHPFLNVNDPDGADDIWFTEDDGLRLFNNAPSPAPDLGMTISSPAFPVAVVSAATTDIRGIARPQGIAYDMGAYEGEIQGPIIYVDAANVDGTHDGTSWATAFNKLEDALAPAVSDGGSPIWVAKGTYAPPAGESYKMNIYNRIYGGFLNSYTDLSQRDWVNNKTILQGNGNRVINNDYTGTGKSVSPLALLDGFTITGGNATGNGGGINNNSASPTLRNLIFINNTASGSGGGLCVNYGVNYGGSLTIQNVTFANNTASVNGGAMAHLSASNTLIQNVIFSNNTAGNRGGALYNTGGNWSIYKSVFSANNAGIGGAYYSEQLSETQMANLVFDSNTAGTGATLFSAVGANMKIVNSTFSKNTATDNTLVAYNNSAQNIGKITGINCVFWGNSNLSNDANTSFTYGINQSLRTGVENEAATQSPFVNADSPSGTDGIWMTDDDGLRLKFGQRPTAINSGKTILSTDFADPTAVSKDITDLLRPVGATFDKGAYEYRSTPGRYFVDIANVSGVEDGKTWTTAFTSLDGAMRNLFSGDEVWVAKGEYLPEANKSFKMVEGTKVYGGFLNTHTTIDQRDPAAHVTIMSGNGTRVISNVFTAEAPMTNATILDGFTVTGGHIAGNGAGIRNEFASPTLRNLIISSNYATAGLGGGIYMKESSSLIDNVVIKGNTANFGAGGIMAEMGTPQLTNVVISNNITAYGYGGGIYTNGALKLTNVVLSWNIASYGGGYYTEYAAAASELKNVVFDRNSAGSGGGFYSSGSLAKLTNVTFSGNEATDGNGGGILIEYSDPDNVIEVTNAVFWGNKDTSTGDGGINADFVNMSYSFTQADHTAELVGNVTGEASPFVDTAVPTGTDGLWFTADDGLILKAGSTAINSGSNAAITGIATDITGRSRINNTTVDMGAYEYYPSSNADLAGLFGSLVTLSPTFNSAQTNYTASLAYATSLLTVTPTVQELAATIQVRSNNGTFAAVVSGQASNGLDLHVGENTVEIKVTAPDGTTTKTYMITVTRAGSSNATLSGLTASAGTMTPTFDAGTISYNSTVANNVETITITPTAQESTATIQVKINEGTFATVVSGEESNELDLNVGANTIEVKVTAPDGTTVKTYTITVTRALNAADLSTLTISAGSLSPAFSKNTLTYTVAVDYATSSLKITPTAVDPDALVEIKIGDGSYEEITSGEESEGIPIKVGANVISIRVTGDDQTGARLSATLAEVVKTYTITVTRAVNPLPVTLVSFAGKYIAPTETLLTWVTADEKDFDRFEIQQSTDAKTFETIGTINGNEKGSYLNTYHFPDKDADASALTYYRLKMIDADGSFIFSRMITIGGHETQNVVAEFYPNPVLNEKVYMDIVASEAGLWKISAVDLSGIEHALTARILSPGQNKVELPVSGLKTGLNLIRFETRGIGFVRKVVVVR